MDVDRESYQFANICACVLFYLRFSTRMPTRSDMVVVVNCHLSILVIFGHLFSPLTLCFIS